jgi:UDP-glucose 4-epimerase
VAKVVDLKRYRKALVTGGAGFIGSHLCEGLLKEGLEVVVLDNLSMGKKENVPEGSTLIVGDVLDFDLVNSIISRGVDVVFHEAAIVSIRESVKNFYNDAMNNIMGTLNILRASIEFKVKKLVYASSMAVYNDNPKHFPVTEDYTKDPMSPYGLSKLASENYLSLMAKSNDIDIIVLRYFNTFGERQTFTPYVGVITIFINKLLRGESPVIFGDGEQTRDFIYVKDIVQANLKAMNADLHWGVFNVGTGVGTTVNEIANILCSKINPDIGPVYTDSKPEELHYSVANIKKIKTQLNFTPQYNIEDSIDLVIKRYITRELI